MKLQAQDNESKTSEVQRLCNGHLPVNKDFAFKTEFEELSRLDLDQIREAIVEFQARLECMKDVNSEVIFKLKCFNFSWNQIIFFFFLYTYIIF